MWMCQVKTRYQKQEMLGSEHDQNVTKTQLSRINGTANRKIDLTIPKFGPRELPLQHVHSET